ncbi:DUF2793 domain-containing protein [Roseibium aestuarii]|uniref:DUF2793 domain-containing protein n=1 Tax=Roseibium aestuarii TaxID=2600299 RepID=A0ABW4JX34_9HYPH|nr:DUF2793 domain-containing protein [Roseibium aestuarii]
MSKTLRLSLPLLAPSQAQKHVTHNEALLTLDVLAHALFESRSLSAPPVAAEGQSFLVGPSASGDWAGSEGAIAHWRDGGWVFFQPFDGLRALVRDEDLRLVHLEGTWRALADLVGPDQAQARSSGGAETRVQVIETDLTDLSGTYAETAELIPDRSLVLAVASRTLAAVTGATSYDVGVPGEVSKFGGSLGVAAGASNIGVIGPTAFYAPTRLRVSANGGAFTGGTVRLSLHVLTFAAPTG